MGFHCKTIVSNVAYIFLAGAFAMVNILAHGF